MKKFYLLAAASLYAMTSFSQETVKFITTVDSINVYNILEENAPGNPNIKDVPTFTLVGKDSKFYMGMGANVKLVGDFDWGSPLSNPNIFAPKDIPMDTEKGDRSQTLFSAGQSNIYWNMVALPGSKNQVGLFFDVILLGTTSKPEIAIHHAYLKYRGFTAGYVVSTFTDLKAEPASIDFGGPASVALVRHPNISYNVKFGKDKMWSAQLGLDMPAADEKSFTAANQTSYVNQRMPDIPLFLQRSWADGKGWLRASAIFRDLQYKNNMSNLKGTMGWGVKLSGKTPICGGLSANYQAVYGEGISSYIQDMSGLGQDLVPEVKDGKVVAGSLKAVPAWGAYGSLRYDFCKKVFMDVTYSHVRAYAKNFGSEWGSMYKYGQYATGNLFVNINRHMQCGVEYLWGRRMNYNHQQNHDNRIMLMLNLSI